MRASIITAVWLAALATSASAQDVDPAAALGMPDMNSGRSLPLEGKVLDIVGIKSAMAGKATPLEDAAQALARQNTTLTVRADELELRVAMPGDILFAFDRADIRRAAEPALAALAKMIAATKPATIVVEGHTDAKGSDTYNDALSQQRAAAVVDWLVIREGQSRSLFTARGLGEKQPVAPNIKADGSDDPDGRQKNRRVEFVFPNVGGSDGG